jgi:hypothetical protein
MQKHDCKGDKKKSKSKLVDEEQKADQAARMFSGLGDIGND